MNGFEFMIVVAALQWVSMVTIRARGWPLYLRIAYLLSSFIAALVGVSAVLDSMSGQYMIMLTVLSSVILNTAVLIYVMMYEHTKSAVTQRHRSHKPLNAKRNVHYDKAEPI